MCEDNSRMINSSMCKISAHCEKHRNKNIVSDCGELKITMERIETGKPIHFVLKHSRRRKNRHPPCR